MGNKLHFIRYPDHSRRGHGMWKHGLSRMALTYALILVNSVRP